MTNASDPGFDQTDRISRRKFLTVGAAAGGGLLLGIGLFRLARPGVKVEGAPAAVPFAPNAFIRIDRQGHVTLIMPQIEMGQGTYTSISMLIAEELEVGLDQVRPEHAPPNDKLYANPIIPFQTTGGSTSIRAWWKPLRLAGATARILLISAAAQRWGVNPATCRASHGTVTHTPSGRKLDYGELVDVAATLPVPANVPLKDPKDFTLIGTPAKRLDTAGKVNGTTPFGIDARVPGMKFATVAACPTLAGTLVSVDDTKALAIPGVRQVVKIEDAVAVVGDHMWAAKQGLAALTITWNEGPNASLSTADIDRAHEHASRGPAVVASATGDAAAAMAHAAKKIEAVYELPYLSHATMEPLNCTVHVRADGCEVWTGSQVLARAQKAAADVTGLPLEKMVVHNHYLGGGFGRRLEVDYVTQAVQIAKQVEGPVKIVWTREEDIQHDIMRPYYHNRIAAGLDAHGLPVAWRHRVTGASILARWFPPAFQNGVDRDAMEDTAGPPYDCPNVLLEYVRHERVGFPAGWWRGVGPTHNVFLVESFVDELAQAAKKDPVAYRRALLGGAPRAQVVLDLAAEKAGWGQPAPAGHGRGVSVEKAMGSYVALVADIAVAKDGTVRVERVVCAADCGQVINPDTVAAQIEGGIMFGIGGALYGEITIKNGRVEQRNFNDYRVLRINEAPVIEVHLVKSGEEPGGMGETGTAAIAPAIGNAIFAATGKRIRKLPFESAIARA
jgi:isoquinoline 1-oxidoreductase beta subunit